MGVGGHAGHLQHPPNHPREPEHPGGTPMEPLQLQIVPFPGSSQPRVRFQRGSNACLGGGCCDNRARPPDLGHPGSLGPTGDARLPPWGFLLPRSPIPAVPVKAVEGGGYRQLWGPPRGWFQTGNRLQSTPEGKQSLIGSSPS